MTRRLATLGLLAAAGCGGAPAGEPAGPAGPLFDHHVHLLSPRLVEDWKALGVPFSRPDSVYTSIAPVLAQGVEGAFVLSMGYLYSSARFRQEHQLDADQEYGGVRRENDHVAAQVGRAPERLVGFCGVNPRRPYALAELGRCRDSLRLGGVKLHLASSDVDPTDSAHVAAVAAVARWTEAAGLPLLLHLDPRRPDLDPGHLEPLLAAVIDRHPALRVIIAHLGGSGGYDDRTRAVFRMLARRTAGRPGGVWFELSAVVLARASEGVPPTTADEAARLAADLEEAGLDRILMGSDYPVFSADTYAVSLRERVALGADAWARILGNRVGPARAAAAAP